MFPRASSLDNSTDSTECRDNVVDRSGLRHWTLAIDRASHGLRIASDLPDSSRATNASGSCLGLVELLSLLGRSKFSSMGIIYGNTTCHGEIMKIPWLTGVSAESRQVAELPNSQGSLD